MKNLLQAMLLFPSIAFAAGVATPPVVVEGFGVNAGASYITNPIPVPSQIGITACRASYNDGFPPLSMSPTGCNPFGQDLNGVLFAATQNTAAWVGGQYWPFSTSFAAANSGYAEYAIVAMAAGNGFWLNLFPGNTVNPDTVANPGVSAGWVPLVSYTVAAVSGLVGGSYTLTPVQASSPILYLSGALTTNQQLILPNWSKSWIIVNNTTGNYTTTVKTATGGGVIIQQAGPSAPTQVYSDGSNIRPLSTYGQTLSAHKASNTLRVSTATYTNDPDLQLVVPAAGTYKVSGTFFFNQATSGGGIKLQMYYSGSAAGGFIAPTGYVGGSNISAGGILAYGFTFYANSAIDITGVQDFVNLTGTLTVASGGTYSLQWAQNSSSANGTTMLAGSFLKLSPNN